MTSCEKPATVKQQMTHRARMDRLLRQLPSIPAERYLCEEHADVIDKDWIAVPHELRVDTNSTRIYAVDSQFPVRQCEWEEE